MEGYLRILLHMYFHSTTHLNQFHNGLMRGKTRITMIELRSVISTLGGCFPRARP